MTSRAAIAASLLIIGGTYFYSRQTQDAAQADAVGNDTTDALSSAAQDTLQFIDSATGGFLKISAMANVPPSILQNRNVQAILRVIRTGEGTADDGGYNRLYGGGSFSSFADHPRKAITKWGITSTAAGAYQFLSTSWDETRRLMGLKDFSPASQDLAAVGRLAARGALDDVINGRFTTAIRKINKEWASLPGSPYGQRTMKFDAALAVYRGSGGLQIEQTALA